MRLTAGRFHFRLVGRGCCCFVWSWVLCLFGVVVVVIACCCLVFPIFSDQGEFFAQFTHKM